MESFEMEQGNLVGVGEPHTADTKNPIHTEIPIACHTFDRITAVYVELS